MLVSPVSREPRTRGPCSRISLDFPFQHQGNPTFVNVKWPVRNKTQGDKFWLVFLGKLLRPQGLGWSLSWCLKQVLACPLVDVHSYSLLSVKKSLCTIFFGTPCRFYFIVKRLKNAFLMYIYIGQDRKFWQIQDLFMVNHREGGKGGSVFWVKFFISHI